MTGDSVERIRELGSELQSLAAEIRAVLNEGDRQSKENLWVRAKLCEARIMGIATELRVIVAGNQSA